MNRYHRYYCSSTGWRNILESSLLPWVLRDAELGDDVLEIGPGPGLVTDLIRPRVERLTSVEVDPKLAAKLEARLGGTNVEVLNADATAMPLDDGRFSSALSLTMLHHVPSQELQDRLLAETFRVLRPGGVFAGSDSTVSFRFRLAHLFDTMVLVDPVTFAGRLERAGFADPQVRVGKGAFKWRALKPEPGATPPPGAARQ